MPQGMELLYNYFSDSISVIDPSIASLANHVKTVNNRGVVYRMIPDNANKTMNHRTGFELYSRSKTDAVSALAADIDDSQTTLTVTAGTGILFGGTDVLVLDDGTNTERVHVVSVAGDVITITRDFDGEGSSAFATATPTSVTFEVSVGSDADIANLDGRTEDTEKYINYPRLMLGLYKVTKMQRDKPRKGLALTLEELARLEALQRVMESVYVDCMYGFKRVPANADDYSSSAGIISQMLDTGTGHSYAGRMITNVGGAFTPTVVKNLLLRLDKYSSASAPQPICMNSANYEVMKGFGDTYLVTNQQTNLAPGSRTVGSYVTGFLHNGTVHPVVVDDDIKSSQVFMLDTAQSYRKWVESEPLRVVDEISRSDSRNFVKTIHGEIGYGLDQVGYDHAIATGLTTSDLNI